MGDGFADSVTTADTEDVSGTLLDSLVMRRYHNGSFRSANT